MRASTPSATSAVASAPSAATVASPWSGPVPRYREGQRVVARFLWAGRMVRCAATVAQCVGRSGGAGFAYQVAYANPNAPQDAPQDAPPLRIWLTEDALAPVAGAISRTIPSPAS